MRSHPLLASPGPNVTTTPDLGVPRVGLANRGANVRFLHFALRLLASPTDRSGRHLAAVQRKGCGVILIAQTAEKRYQGLAQS